MPQISAIIPFRGGLDLVTPAIEKRPGTAIAASNYESEARGYRRIAGWERFDGQRKPSQASYSIIEFDAGATAIVEDDEITGATSSATAIALADAVVESGTWAGGDAVGYVPVFNISGTFVDNENLEVAASAVAVTNGLPIPGGADTDALNTAYYQAAVTKRRALISAVPGSGPVRGLFSLDDEFYAVRDNVGATAGVLHKATSAGWAAQTFGHTLDFTGGNVAALQEGETITGGTSSATATVQRVVLTSGAWGGTAAGYLVLSGITGTFGAAETITGGTSSGTATASGVQEAITLPAGGRYRSIRNNFFGAANLERIYAVNGVGFAFEWDGTVMAPIRTGVAEASDTPTHVGELSNHLLLGYAGGALLYSGIGEPLQFLATLGSGELSFGESFTNIKSSTRTAAVLTGSTRVGYLTGTDDTTFQLDMVSEDSGALPDSMEAVGEIHFLDNRGVRSMRGADTFGNWQIGTATRRVEPWFRSQRARNATVAGALRVRSKDQYRLIYTDGTGMVLYFGRENPEALPIELSFSPFVVESFVMTDGEEILLAGADDGTVYQIDAGTSADGAELESFLRLAFMHQGAPNNDKRYHRALIDVDAAGAATTLTYSSDYAFGDPEEPSGFEATATIRGGGGFWGSAIWDEFYWDAAVQGTAVAELSGIGRNLSMTFYSSATFEEPHVLASMTINYSTRRRHR